MSTMLLNRQRSAFLQWKACRGRPSEGGAGATSSSSGGARCSCRGPCAGRRCRRGRCVPRESPGGRRKVSRSSEKPPPRIPSRSTPPWSICAGERALARRTRECPHLDCRCCIGRRPPISPALRGTLRSSNAQRAIDALLVAGGLPAPRILSAEIGQDSSRRPVRPELDERQYVMFNALPLNWRSAVRN